jgi:four helix bundle protein
MKENILKDKSYAFALKTINIYKHLTEIKREFVISKQLLRSGTSIGANIEEAIGGQSRSDFIAKLSIAYKEARETNYWISLLTDSGYLSKKDKISLIEDCSELLRILAAILQTTKKKS